MTCSALKRLCAWCLILVAVSASLDAQAPNAPGLEAFRIFVEEKDVDRVVTPAFLTVRMEELDKLLKDYVQRRSLAAVQDAGIQRATYVARWNEQTLTSRASQFQVTGTRGSNPLNIGRISLAIEEPQGVPEQSLPLTRQLRYLEDQRLQIMGDQQQQDLWFGFKAKTRRRDSGNHTIDLEVPQAVISTMLIAVPTHTVVTANVPCAAVTDVNRYLPEGWPSTALPSLTADEQWFAIWLSGKESCTLNFTLAAKVPGEAYRMLVASAQSDTQVTPAGIQVSSQFRLPSAPPGGKLRLVVEEPLHVRAVSVGAVEVTEWRAINDEPVKIETPNRPRSRIIEVPCEPNDNGMHVVTVDCIGRVPLPFDGALPRVEVEGAYVLDGRCTLVGNDRIQVEDARSTAHVLASTAQSGIAQWQWQWTGRAPSTNVRLRIAPHQWTVRALTRFDVQPGVIVASVHANVSTAQVQGNQTTLKLASGWFVDSVELENAPSGVTARINDAAGDAAELHIRWDDRLSDLDVRVLLKAHYHQSTEVENMRLTSTRILSLPGADQVDNYVVESSGRFRLELDSELLRLRVREDDLIPWQRALLPRLADAWIFSAGRAALPPIRLSRTRATIEAKLHTTLIEDNQQIVANYAVLCTPISGSIKQLKIQMSLPANAVAPTWSIVDPFSVNSRTKLMAISSAISSSSGETTFTIDLSEDVAEKFQLQTELLLARKDNSSNSSSAGPGATIAVPLPRMRQAVSQEAVLVVPTRYKLPSLPSMEILPPGLCCDGGKLVEASSTSEVVAVRYDASASAKVDLQPESAAGRGGWAHSQLHEHWQYRAGRTLHRSTWELASPTAQKLELTIPPYWEFQSLSVNQEAANVTPARTNSDGSNLSPDGGQSVIVSLPRGNRVRVQLLCSSTSSGPWYQPAVIEHPAMPLPVLSSRSVIWFPNSRWATVGWPAVEGTWEDRFCPRQWWKLLGMQPGPTPLKPSNDQLTGSSDIFPESERANSQIVTKNDWWSMELDGTEPVRVWTIDQSLAGAACLSGFLWLCIVISMACNTRWSRWWALWMVIGIALAVVPASALLVTQLLALALAASTLVRLARFTTQRSRATVGKRVDSMSLSKSILPRSGVVSLWLAVAVSVGTSTAMAQPLKNAGKEKREVFGILIPVDDKYKVAGEYVYVSPRLYGLLRNANQSDAQTSEVRVAGAIYSLSISNDLVNSTNTVGDVTVELTVQATMADAELRLPYLRSEVTLIRASLDSQSLIQGDRVRQENEMIVWRAADSDRHTLRLTLRPRTVTQREGRGQLALSIPAIPTARLEIQSENVIDLREINIESIGGTQNETFRTLAARLGPLNRLNVSWPLSSTRSGPTQVHSDTWVHSRGEKVMAMCQLRMRGAASLNGTLIIAGDSHWVPVGQDWHDFRLISTEGASAAGKPVYNVEKIEDRNGDELTLRVLMLPKDEASASLSIPFLTMQQPLMSATRTFALSHTDTPQWKAVGADWQPLLASQATQLWDRTRLADQPTLWKVPVGPIQANLQRAELAVSGSVDEVTEVQMQMPETKIKYVARWSTPLIGPPAIRFQIPNGLRVDSALVDAIKARHSIRRIPGSSTASELIVFVDSSLGGIQSLNLQFSMPTRLNRAFRLPRPLLMETDVRTSVVQVYRGVELSSSLAVVDGSSIEVESVEVRDRQLLQELQLPVGRLELGNRLRDNPELPLEVTLARAPTARTGRAVMRFTRNDQGWRGQLDAVIEMKAGELNHVFFDIPRSLEASLKEPLDANVAMSLWPSPDSNRMLLSVMPTRGTGDQVQLSFAFRLPGSGVSQTINIPDIRMLGVNSPRPALALPKDLAGETVRWTGVGRQLAAGWLQLLGEKEKELVAFDLFEPIDSQSQAVWHPREQREKDTELLLTCVEVYDNSQSAANFREHGSGRRGLQGEICYWLEPHDHSYLDIDVPDACQLVGLEANDRPTNWLHESPGRVRVLLQPSYLPTRLRLLVRWPQATAAIANVTLALPQPQAWVNGPVFVRQRNSTSSNSAAKTPWMTVTQARSEAATEVETRQAQLWATTLTRSALAATGRGSDELAVWLPSWDPIWLGLNSESLVSVRRQAIASRNGLAEGPSGEETQLTVNEFWREFLKQHGMESYQSTDYSLDQVASDWPIENMRAIAQYSWQEVQVSENEQLDSLTIASNVMPNHQELVWRWSLGISWVVLIMGIGSLAGGSLRGFCNALGEQVWPVWLVLTVASAVLLPVLWPSAVIATGLAIVLIRRYRETRRDRQFVLMPKRLV